MSLIGEHLFFSYFIDILWSIPLPFIDRPSLSNHLSPFNTSSSHFFIADNYLLQIQPYNFMPSKAKTDSTSASTTSKTEPNEAVALAAHSTKTKVNDTNTGVDAPGTDQTEVTPTWYDVDVVNGTEYTVTDYSTNVDFRMDQVRCG